MSVVCPEARHGNTESSENIDEAVLFWSMGTPSRQSFVTVQRTHPGLAAA